MNFVKSYKTIYLNLLFVFILFNIVNSSDHKKKGAAKEKHHKPPSFKKDGCSHFDDHHHLTTEKRVFLPTSRTVSNNPKYSPSSYHSIEWIYEFLYKDICNADPSLTKSNEDLIEFNWRYQYVSALSCIRIELDLGNLTKFKSLFDFDYYEFSYREFSKKNNHLRRQPINDSINSLTLYRVQQNPYIICVTFFKNGLNALEEINNLRLNPKSNWKTNDTIEKVKEKLSCNGFKDLLSNNIQAHDVDLCIDIDLNADESSDHGASQDGIFVHANRELIMVVFIICLLVITLVIISIAHNIIEKPKKERMMHMLRNYMQKKYHKGSGTNLNSSQAVLNTVNNLSFGAPMITVTDLSESNNTLHSKTKSEDDFKEKEPLMAKDGRDCLKKITFSLGETIVEEPSNEADEVDSSKYVSHLLDNKPWAH